MSRSYRASIASIAVAALFVLIIVPPALMAQTLAARSVTAVSDVSSERPERLDMLVGRSTVIRMDKPITRVSLSTPEIADAMVTSPYELLIHGKAPGTISMFVWSDGGRIKTYDVAVKRDLSSLEEQVHKLFPGEPILVSSNGKDVVLSGSVSAKFVADRAATLALGFVDKPENVVNLLRQREGGASDQVMLQVRFAEVSRSALQELGASFFTGPNGHKDWIGRSTTEQFEAPDFDAQKGLVFSDFLNIFLFNTKESLGTLIRALSEKGLFQSLAEPNLITQDGKEANFLAGGEFPYPVVQGQAANTSVTIVFKEFGIRLKFTPTILDDVIHLKVAPEVSSLDFTNGVVMQGFRIPALSTRRTETEVELADGQTFAVAGLLDNNVSETLSRVPGIGDIPVLGYLFRSRAYQKHSTELVVMITPRIIHRGSYGVTPNLPAPIQPYLQAPPKRLPVPPPAFTPPQQGGAVMNQAPDMAQQQAMPVAPGVEPVQAQATQPMQAAADAPVVTKAEKAAQPKKKNEKQMLEDAAKAKAEEQKRAAAEQRIADETRKKQDEEDRIAAATAAKATADKIKADREAAEREQAEAAKKAEADAKEAARAKQVSEVMAREEARKKAEQAKLDWEHQQEEQKLTEKKKQADEKLAKEQAKRDEALLKSLSQGAR